MGIVKLVELVSQFFQTTLHKPANVIGVTRMENGWWVEVETIEDSEYLRKRGQDDILALYQVEVHENGEILGYQRKGLRERTQVETQLQD